MLSLRAASELKPWLVKRCRTVQPKAACLAGAAGDLAAAGAAGAGVAVVACIHYKPLNPKP